MKILISQKLTSNSQNDDPSTSNSPRVYILFNLRIKDSHNLNVALSVRCASSYGLCISCAVLRNSDSHHLHSGSFSCCPQLSLVLLPLVREGWTQRQQPKEGSSLCAPLGLALSLTHPSPANAK